MRPAPTRRGQQASTTSTMTPARCSRTTSTPGRERCSGAAEATGLRARGGGGAWRCHTQLRPTPRPARRSAWRRVRRPADLSLPAANRTNGTGCGRTTQSPGRRTEAQSSNTAWWPGPWCHVHPDAADVPLVALWPCSGARAASHAPATSTNMPSRGTTPTPAAQKPNGVLIQSC